MLELRLGSIFDSKADLVIVPCDALGGVTQWVFDELKYNGLSAPGVIPFGEVQFEPTALSFENAEYIGFAASVSSRVESNAEAISKIASAVVGFAKREGLGIINLPLLGTGAGGLSAIEVLKVFQRHFADEEASQIRAIVFTPSRNTYKSLQASLGPRAFRPKLEIKIPRVFISYAGDNNENAQWAKLLATRLRENGVNARFDRFHLKPGVDLAQWMTNEVIMADKVLLICDSNYMVKADVRRGGVGWETMVIQGDMLTQGETRNKYIALVREESVDKGLPIYMKSKLALHWEKQDDIDEDAFKELMIALFDFDLEPKLGELPDYILQIAGARE